MTENNRTEFEEEQTTTDFEEAVGSGQEDNEAVSEKQMAAPASKEESEESRRTQRTLRQQWQQRSQTRY